ncbi:NAD(P)/FAD-dependent oxidoreductase [Nocardia sp. 348MFTsu5.1]|uniref:flavin-containing monooxygenase n=1 Tax=Nocardia sp. 348MFTsu5.1 TaxID=1172185 RepID=UPI00035F9429|nr:NAD(P)/FAD-dependent oxidoreductase [Nocardia sp. 348MFTsu5.1]
MNRPDYEVIIIGAGPGGICAGAQLVKRGIEDFLILDRGDGFGGSWRDNHYPGLGVDVPGFCYQYSFRKNPDWSRMFPRGAEVLAYHREVAADFQLGSRTRFGVRVVREVWDETNDWWEIHTDGHGVITGRFVISAIGAYIQAKADPGIDGLGDFRGEILRPDNWDHDYDLSGKRVAVIGTGASSVQISPSIAPVVQHLSVFQRTPVWCLPKPDMPMKPWMQRGLRMPGVGASLAFFSNVVIETFLRIVYQTPRALFRPGARVFDVLGRALYRTYLRAIVRDKQTRSRLAPAYGVFGKRPTLSNDYVANFNRDNVELVTSAITGVTPHGIRTADGVERDVDAIVLATGYELFSDPESYRRGAVLGRDHFDLADFYNTQGLQAYQSVAVPKLPNRWMLVGPYSWIGTGWHELVEISSGHAVNVIDHARRAGYVVAEVSQVAHESYQRKVREQGANIAYYFGTLNKGLRTYYVNSQGDMPYIRPTSLFEARRESRNPCLDDYEFRSAPIRLPGESKIPDSDRVRSGKGFDSVGPNER